MTASLRTLTKEKRGSPMKRLPMPATALAAMKKVAIAMFCGAVLMIAAAPARADICTEASPATSAPCDVTITISGSTGNLSVAIEDLHTNYPGAEGDDKLIGVKNLSSVDVGAIVLSGSDAFDFSDHDGACTEDLFPPSFTCGTTGYEGPNNTFVGINSPSNTTGKVLFTTPLAKNGGTVVFSLEGPPSTVVAVGENKPLVAGQTTVFPFGPFSGSGVEAFGLPDHPDDYQITPVNSATGDTMTITPVPVMGPFNSGTKFPGLACVPYKDFNNDGPVCVEVERDCFSGGHLSSGDCDTFLYSAKLDFNIDSSGIPNPNGIGGAALLGQPIDDCPPTNFSLNITTSYTGSQVDPISGSGKGGHSCFVAAFDPNAATVVTQGQTVSTFFGFEFPVVNNPKVNTIFPPLPVPLSWDSHDSSNHGIPNLHLCTNSSGTGCTAPWVHLSSTPVASCGSFTGEDPLPGVFANLSKLLGAGEYTFFWDTSKKKGPSGCKVSIVLQFDSGAFDTPATFKYH